MESLPEDPEPFSKKHPGVGKSTPPRLDKVNIDANQASRLEIEMIFIVEPECVIPPTNPPPPKKKKKKNLGFDPSPYLSTPLPTCPP